MLSALATTLLAGLATPSATASLTLAQALSLARSHAPSYAAAQARVLRAQAVVSEHGAAWRPTVSLPIGYVHNDNGRFVSLNGTDEYTLQAAVHVPLFDPVRDAAYRSAEAQLEGVKLNLAQVGRGVDLAVLEAYFAVLKSQEALSVENSGHQTLQEEAAAAQRRFDQGVSSRLDLDRARLALAQQQSAVAASVAAVGTAQRHLASLLGIPAAGSLAMPPAPPRVQGDLSAQAQAHRPEIRAARADVRAARSDLHAAEAARHWPAIGPDLMAGWDSNGPPASIFGQVGWSAGISVSVPIYSGGAGGARVEEARQAEAIRRADLLAVLNATDLSIGDDRAAVAAAREQERLAAQQVKLAQAELQMSRFGFSQGSVPLIEVLRAEQAAIGAAASLGSARLDLELSRYRLAWDVGAQLP